MNAPNNVLFSPAFAQVTLTVGPVNKPVTRPVSVCEKTMHATDSTKYNERFCSLIVDIRSLFLSFETNY